MVCHEDGQKPEKVARRGCEVFMFGGVKSLSVQSSEQPNLVRPALSRALDYTTSECPFQAKLWSGVTGLYSKEPFNGCLSFCVFSSLVESLHVAVTLQGSETDRSPEESIEELSVRHRLSADEILESVPSGE